MYYTYILESETSGILYIGQTDNLDAIVKRHNYGGSTFTRDKGPWKLLYHFTEAVATEKKLKNFKNPNKVKEYIHKHKSSVG